jgi:acyl phosphate:glycerol-3-phosphate acyltransferase
VIDGATLGLDLVLTVVALLGGYLVGSLPSAAWIGRTAGVDPLRDGERNPGAANIWKLAGPGWGFLALTADLAKGVIPVAVGIVTWSWSIGWVAGLGALLGACWPALGRRPGGRGVATFSGVAFALAPPAGTVSVLLTLLVVGIGRLVRRNTRVVAVAVGIGSFPPLFLAVQQDIARLCAVLVLYLVTLARFLTTRDR